MSIVVAFGEDSAAYPVKDLVEVVNDTIGEVPVAIVLDPTTEGSWTVLSRTLDNATIVNLVHTGSGELLDTVTNTAFDSSRGTGISGPLANQVLDQLPAFTSFAEDYFTFYPEGRIWVQK